jgi:hypothetical protein
MSLFKAQAHMRELKQRLKLLMSAASFSGSQYADQLDANGMPILKVVNAGESQFIHIETVGNAGRVNGLGLPQDSYSPHKAEILRVPAANAADAATREIVLSACSKLGMRLEIWEQNPLPASFDLSGATMLLALPSDEINALTMSQ